MLFLQIGLELFHVGDINSTWQNKKILINIWYFHMSSYYFELFFSNVSAVEVSGSGDVDPVLESLLNAYKWEIYLFISPNLMDFDTAHMISHWLTQPCPHTVMQHWPPLRRASRLSDSTTHQLSSVTHRLSLHDGLHNGLWWIMRLTFTQKQQKPFCPAGWRHASLVLRVVSRSRGSVLLFFYLFDTSRFLTGALMKTASSWKCHFFAFLWGLLSTCCYGNSVQSSRLFPQW